jgi:hypothetical protein
VQVSRLGNPLVNEVVIPLKDKDKFNATEPTGDGAFLPYVLNPELAGLLTALYGIPTPPAPRNDLVAVFLTGIPGLNKPANANQVPCEMLRLNMAIPASSQPSRLGILAGDNAGFPNGRRLGDDVIDIAERVVAGATPFTPDFNKAPNNQLGDGVDSNDLPFLPYFPYVAPPHNPADHQHHATVQGPPFGNGNGNGPGDDDGHGHGIGRGHGNGHGNGHGDGDDATFAIDPSQQPMQLSISGANPGSESALRFSIPSAGHVSLKVFDVRGRVVRTLVDQDAAAGSFTARWNGFGDDGSRAGAGVYFVRLSAGGQTTDRKVVLQ